MSDLHSLHTHAYKIDAKAPAKLNHSHPFRRLHMERVETYNTPGHGRGHARPTRLLWLPLTSPPCRTA